MNAPASPPADTSWRTARATRAALVVDAADYFAHARAAMLRAERRIMLIGWDFDARIRLGEPGEDGAPATIGEFVLWLANRRPGLEIYLLRWDFGMVKSLFRGITPLTLLRWRLHKRIRLKLDSAHPTGASHHQKIVVIDDCFAFCGGIDMTSRRWDRRAHEDDDPLRVGPDGKPYMPWHDATMALEGEAAAALGDLARDRWACAGGGKLAPAPGQSDCWPDALEPGFRDVEIAISRTRPDHGEVEAAYEIEALYLALIARARRSIYAESQYFASRRIAEAIAKRLGEPGGPEIVLINPARADGWLEQKAMDTARARLVETLNRADAHRRFRLYHPVTAGGAPIYVHAKIMIVDGEVLRVGSSNWNNRSLRLDTECDVTIDAALPGNEGAAPAIRSLLADLLAEHLGADPAEIARALAESGSLIRTVEALRGPGRSLRPYRIPDLNAVEEYLADHEALDPEGPGEMFEPLARRGLFRLLPRPGGSGGTTPRRPSLPPTPPSQRRSHPMSSIPSSAIPHAGPAAETEEEGGVTLASRARDGAGKIAGLVRENPKKAIAAGAAVAAGVATAAVVRARRGKSGPAKAGGANAKAPARKKPKAS